MGSIIDWLNSNSGAVTAAATTIYAAVTLLLLFEARRARQLQDEAALAVWPTPWGDGLYLALRLENYGPAIARDVRLRYWYEIDGQTVEGLTSGMRTLCLGQAGAGTSCPARPVTPTSC